MWFPTTILISFGFSFSLALAQTVTIHKKDAVVWAQQQTISGEVDVVISLDGTLFLNDQATAFSLDIGRQTFSVPVEIGEGENTIVVQFTDGQQEAVSDTLRLTLGYKLRPEIFVSATVNDRNVTLQSEIVDNPEQSTLFYIWKRDEKNPLTLNLQPNGEMADVSIPADAPWGEYYFSVAAVDADEDTLRAETYVTVDESGVRPFDIKTDHSAWIDQAIIYEITPYNFVFAGKFQDITAKLAEIAALGINTIWLQPVYKTQNRGQGYDLIEYFAVRPDLGPEEELRQLIATAKALGLRVMFDFVPGHTSIDHPYAKDASAHGTDSHYHDFYAPIKSGVRYAMHYNKRTRGEMTFTYYFWEDLPMLNYDNPEVQRMMIEAAKFWVEKFDIDGYRVDAVWGANARNPEFATKFRLALKRLKPDLFLLAEDKATDPTGVVFDERFDAAYDWFPEEPWVSHWVWQTFFSTSTNPTIFNNNNERQRAALLRSSLTNNGSGYHPDAKILRFMENNDTFRFLASHDLESTKMVATLMFSLHGIPLIYQGQEIGAGLHPYQTSFVFPKNGSIASRDTRGLIPFYRDLTIIRRTYPALYSDNFEEIQMSPGDVAFAYRRWQGNQNIFGVINMGSSEISAELQIASEGLNLDENQTYNLTDLLSGEAIATDAASLGSLTVPVERFTTRLFILADSVVVTSVAEHPIAGTSVPDAFTLAQNYPNPFNPRTQIDFSLPRSGFTKLVVFDVLGREVQTVIARRLQAGSHKVEFDGSHLPSGMYLYRLEFGERILVRKMLLVK